MTDSTHDTNSRPTEAAPSVKGDHANCAPVALPKFDIEHMPVENDPREWSRMRKNFCLFLVASASMIAGLAGNIQNPAVQEMETDLPATSAQFSLSLSIFILLQGVMPLGWSAISEIKGRKLVYLVSLSLFTVGSIVTAISNNIQLVIGFRAMQAIGSSAVMTIGAATLADIFEPAERGTKMGIYYIAPLLGPAVGAIFGGVLTTGFNWRATFWFLAIISGASCLSFFLFFKDTYRQGRSLVYQNILKQRLAERHNSIETITAETPVEAATAIQGQPGGEKNLDDPEKGQKHPEVTLPTVKISLADLNPVKPIVFILRRWNNVVILIASGILFAFAFFIAYTCARTLSSGYHYDPLKIGFVILAFGLGSVAGSLLGGRWSDHELARLKAANGGISYPEMRLKSAIYGICMLPPCVLGYGWASNQRVHISAICVLLFACGFFSIWTYASTLAYIVDANVGRSSPAVATNSAFRGISAFIVLEIAVPLQDGLGDGWTYTIFSGLMLISGILIQLVSWKGQKWREAAAARDARHAEKHEAHSTLSITDASKDCKTLPP